MEFSQVMQQLEAGGSEQTRKTYMRHGVTGPLFGVSFGELRKFSKSLRKNQDLAQELWQSGNHDARVLATLIADDEKLDLPALEVWLRQLKNPVLADMFVELVARSALLETCLQSWSPDASELTGKVWWNLMARRAMARNELPDAVFEPCLQTIAAELPQRPDLIRHAMNMTLCAIGARSPALHQQALVVARKLGKVQVDHGKTACKTPDAEAYIARTVAKKGYVYGS